MVQSAEWITTTVGAIAGSERNALVGGPFGSNLVSKDYRPVGVPVIRGQNMGHGRWVSGEFAYVSEEKARELSANIARPWDIVFTQRGTIGQVALVPASSFDRYIVSQSQMKLTVDPAKADPLFIYYLFSSPTMQQYMATNAIQTGVPHTNLGILRETPITIPARVEEQRAIAHIVGTLDDKIELNRQMNWTLEEIVWALFTSWFVNFDPVRAKAEGRSPEGIDIATAGLFPNSFVSSAIGDIPDGWKVKPIGDAVTTLGGATPSTKKPAYWVNGSHLWATPKDLSSLTSPILIDTTRKITDEGVRQISSRQLPVGTVLLSSRAPIGYLALTTEATSINQGFIAMVCDGVLPNYYVINWARKYMDTIKSNAGGTTFAEISKTAFRPIPVLVPDSLILNRFVEEVGPLYRKIELNLRENRLIGEIRDLLLPALLTGTLSTAALAT